MTLFRSTVGITLLLLTTGCSRNAQYYTEKGTKAAESGNDTDAILNFRKAVKKDPNFGPAFLGLGLAHQRQSNMGEAYASLKQAAALLPHSEEAMTKFGDICLNIYVLDQTHPKPLYDQLSSLTDQMLARNAQSIDGLRLKGNLALLDKKYDQAIEYFRKADQAKPMQSNVILPLAQILFATDQPAEAEKLSLQLIDKEKSFGASYDLLYMYYAKSNRVADAENILRRKVENNPNSAGARLQQAAHYARIDKRQEMVSTLQRLLDAPKEFPKARLQVGDFYLALGSLEQALAQYQDGLKSSSPDTLLYQKRIVAVLLRQGNRDDALKLLEPALKQNPDDDELKATRAALLVHTKQPENMETALAAFKELAAKKPDDPVRRVNHGRAAMLKGDIDTAKKEFLEALKRSPSSMPIRALLADVSLRKGDYNEALKYADEILKTSPDIPGARLARSASLMGLGRFKEARPELDKILAARPQLLEAQLQLGSLALAEGRPKDAEDVFRKSHQAAQGDIRPLEGIVAARMEQQQTDSALQLISQELGKSPDSAALRGLLVQTALRAGKLDLAIAQLQQMLSQKPDSVELYHQLGEVFRAKGEYPNALAQYEKGRQRAPKNVRLQAAVAAAETTMGRKDAARESYRKALALQPDSPFLKNDLAYLIIETNGDPREAQKLVQEALKTHPQQPNFMDTLATVYQKTGQTDSALQVLNNLVRQYPKDPTFQYHLAVSLTQKGNREKAREALTLALVHKPDGPLEASIRELLVRLK